MDERLKNKVAAEVKGLYPGWQIEVVDAGNRHDFYTTRLKKLWLIPLRSERLQIFSIIEEDSGELRLVAKSGNQRTVEIIQNFLTRESVRSVIKRS